MASISPTLPPPTVKASLPPVVIVVNGAWHTPLHYYPLTHALTAAGFLTVCPPLPTCSNIVPPYRQLASDVLHIRAVATDLSNRGYPIIALCRATAA